MYCLHLVVNYGGIHVPSNIISINIKTQDSCLKVAQTCKSSIVKASRHSIWRSLCRFSKCQSIQNVCQYATNMNKFPSRITIHSLVFNRLLFCCCFGANGGSAEVRLSVGIRVKCDVPLSQGRLVLGDGAHHIRCGCGDRPKVRSTIE